MAESTYPNAELLISPFTDAGPKILRIALRVLTGISVLASQQP